jgi:hypothetical protein
MSGLVRPVGENTAIDGSTDHSILTRMQRFRKNPFNFAHELSLFIRGVGWRAYDDPIGQPVFYSGYTATIKHATMASPLLRQKLVDLTEERLKLEEKEGLLDNTSPAFLSEKESRRNVIISQLLEVTDDMLDKMVCKMESKLFIRGAFWGAAQLLLRAYSAIHVAEAEVDRLREVATEAAKKKQSIIFLPRHTSHVDYVTLQLICYRLGMTLPVVIAGDNCEWIFVLFQLIFVAGTDGR